MRAAELEGMKGQIGRIVSRTRQRNTTWELQLEFGPLNKLRMLGLGDRQP